MNIVLQKKIETKGRKNFQHKLKFPPLEFTQETKTTKLGAWKGDGPYEGQDEWACSFFG
jgi:hypothetical protein